jgi:hypothetical protein
MQTAEQEKAWIFSQEVNAMTVNLKIVWRNPEPIGQGCSTVTRSAAGEYVSDGTKFEVVYGSAHRAYDEYSYEPALKPQETA